MLKPAIEGKAKEQQGARTDIPQKPAKGLKPIDTKAAAKSPLNPFMPAVGCFYTGQGKRFLRKGIL
jgi:hypothetical protein